MKRHPSWLSRRGVLTGLGGGAVAAVVPWTAAHGQNRPTLALRLKPASAVLRDNLPPAAVWDLEGPQAALQFTQGDELQVTLANDLPVPVALDWRGIDGVAQIEPLVGHPPLLPGQTSSITLPLRQAGTVLCDTRLLGDGQARALPVKALSILEKPAIAVGRDHVLLIEEWRFKSDGSTASPGDPNGNASDAVRVFTINGKPAMDIPVVANDRLRLRFINACQRSVIAIKIYDHDVRVMAVDGRPAEPFLARDGQLVLAPGTRIDAFVDTMRPPSSVCAIQLHDGTSPRPIARLVYGSEALERRAPLLAPQPLPSTGLPQKLDLQSAMRIDLPLDTRPNASTPDWLLPTTLSAPVAPAFRIKRGRVAVLALANRAATPVVFHLHGHPFRLLDRLDDGWKPFWLDTLLLDARQTQRIAFAADTAGSWLMEAMGTDWTAPRLARWYVVE
jgi:FtsP/CotA-like multicopper oxidase with cupredoxin domain